MNLQTKREREKKTVSLMIRLYCRKKHGGKQLCADCAALDAYARSRSDSCPFMETKTFCSNCTVHCYRPDMREEIRKVMRFSGPRMMLYHPVMAIRHVVSSRMEKKKMQKDLKAFLAKGADFDTRRKIKRQPGIGCIFRWMGAKRAK